MKSKLKAMWARMTDRDYAAAAMVLLASVFILRVAVGALELPHLGLPVALVFVCTAIAIQVLYWSEVLPPPPKAAHAPHAAPQW